MQFLRIGLFVSLLLVASAHTPSRPASDAQGTWVKKKEAGGITVLERKDPVQAKNFLKAQMVLPATSLKALTAILMDVAGYAEWVDRTSQAHVLERISDTVQIYRAVLDVPLITDRDLVAAVRVGQDQKTKVVCTRIESVEGIYPPQPGFARLKGMRSHWLLTPLGDGQVRVEYFGSVADDWAYAIVKSFIWNGLHRTLDNLRAKSRQKHPNNPVAAFIQEPI